MSQIILVLKLSKNINEIVSFLNVTTILISFNEEVTLAQYCKNLGIFFDLSKIVEK